MCILVGQTVVEALQRVAHTDNLVNRIVVHSGDAYYGADRIQVIREITDHVFLVHHRLNLIFHERSTFLGRQVRFVRQNKLMSPFIEPVAGGSMILCHACLLCNRSSITLMDRLFRACHIVYIPIYGFGLL